MGMCGMCGVPVCGLTPPCCEMPLLYALLLLIMRPLLSSAGLGQRRTGILMESFCQPLSSPSAILQDVQTKAQRHLSCT